MVVLGADNSFYSFWKGFKVFHPWFLEFFPVEEIVFYWESYFCRKKNDMHAFNYLVISIFLIGETLTGRISVKGVLKNFRGTCPCRRLCFHTAPRCRHLPRHPLSGIWLYKNILKHSKSWFFAQISWKPIFILSNIWYRHSNTFLTT